jgi:hypothetical protein
MMLAVRLIALAVLLLLVGPAGAGGSALVSFRTPSGNIGCVYSSGLDGGTSLRCDIRSGLKPRPPKPKACDLDWGDSYELSRTGRPVVTCHGDTAIIQSARVLRYGSSWSRSGFVCVSRVTGLRCRNASGHGFFLSKQRSYRF